MRHRFTARQVSSIVVDNVIVTGLREIVVQPGTKVPVGTVVTAARAGAGWELLAVLKDDRLDAELRWGDSNGPPVRLLDLPYTLSL